MYVIARIRMANNPRPIETKTGTRMQTGFGFVDIDGDEQLPAGVVAFGSLADELAKYRKGDTIRLSGEFKANNYTNKAGEEIHGYQITAEGIAGIKSATVKHRHERKQDNKQDIQRGAESQNAFMDSHLSELDGR